MKRKKIVFGISLLMMIGIIIPTSLAQDFKVTPLQLKQTNILFNRLEELEIQDSINTELLYTYESIIGTLEEKDSLREEAIVDINNRLRRMNDDIVKMEVQNTTLHKQRKIATYWAGGATGICVILLIILL